jgi:hypothetical protein
VHSNQSCILLANRFFLVDFEASPQNESRKRSIGDRDEVWISYLREAASYDHAMLKACHKNMDVLLIFVGPWSDISELISRLFHNPGWFILCGGHRVHRDLVHSAAT